MPTVPATFTSPLAAELAPAVLERLVRYARFDTQADRRSGTRPSSLGQRVLLDHLADELRGLGLADVAIGADAVLTATLPGTESGDDVPVIGLLAHVDTSPDAPASGVEPLVHRDYDGGAIALPRGGTVLDPEAMPELSARVGHDLVSSSGDTLLGADDKAGLAEIVTAVAHLVAHPELPRPVLRLAFTPDEEIGHGVDGFDVAGFGALCAYTVDGSEPGELQDETFTAAGAVVRITGHDVHPGFATGKLVNAARLAARVLAALPAELTPERTAGREGFIHPVEVRGTAASAEIELIVRDFDDELLAGHVALLRETAERVVGEEPRARVEVAVTPQYPNMREHLATVPAAVQVAEAAIAAEGLEPVRTSIRGGTDGSQLSAMGLPTPNVFTGGHEYHSVREWASVQEMAAAAATLVRLAELWAAPQRRGTVARER